MWRSILLYALHRRGLAVISDDRSICFWIYNNLAAFAGHWRPDRGPHSVADRVTDFTAGESAYCSAYCGTDYRSSSGNDATDCCSRCHAGGSPGCKAVAKGGGCGLVPDETFGWNEFQSEVAVAMMFDFGIYDAGFQGELAALVSFAASVDDPLNRSCVPRRLNG